MSLQQILVDNAYLEKNNGQRLAPFKTKFGGVKLVVFNDQFEVAEGDVVIHVLDDTQEQRFIVTSVQFNSGMMSIDAHYLLSIINESELQNTPYTSTSSAIQENDFTAEKTEIHHIMHSFDQLIKKIELSQSSADDKAEAKALLKAFIVHPTVNDLLSGSLDYKRTY